MGDHYHYSHHDHQQQQRDQFQFEPNMKQEEQEQERDHQQQWQLPSSDIFFFNDDHHHHLPLSSSSFSSSLNNSNNSFTTHNNNDDYKYNYYNDNNFSHDFVDHHFDHHVYNDDDILSHHFSSSLSLLRQRRLLRYHLPTSSPPTSRIMKSRLGHMALHHRASLLGRWSYDVNGGRGNVELGQSPGLFINRHETVPFRRSSTSSSMLNTEAFYEFQVQSQVDRSSHLGRRLRIPQTQDNRVYPFQGSRFGSGCGGGGGGGSGSSGRGGGTGVFIPRKRPTTTTAAAASDVERRQGMRISKQEIDFSRQRNSIRRVGMGLDGVQEDCYCHLPAEMGLPQSWTY